MYDSSLGWWGRQQWSLGGGVTEWTGGGQDKDRYFIAQTTPQECWLLPTLTLNTVTEVVGEKIVSFVFNNKLINLFVLNTR